MKKFLINTFLTFVLSGLALTQVKPDIKPLSIETYPVNKKNIIYYENQYIDTSFPDNIYVSQIDIDLEESNKYKLEIKINDLKDEDRIFIINRLDKSYIGPYTNKDILNGFIYTDIIHAEKITIEINSEGEIIDKNITLLIRKYQKPTLSSNI